MNRYTDRYLERLCEALAVDNNRGAEMVGRGIEPFGLATTLRYSPTRTKRVLRELLQHHLVDVHVAVGSDGRNELRVSCTRETERWYARTLRFRRALHQRGSAPVAPPLC